MECAEIFGSHCDYSACRVGCCIKGIFYGIYTAVKIYNAAGSTFAEISRTYYIAKGNDRTACQGIAGRVKKSVGASVCVAAAAVVAVISATAVVAASVTAGVKAAGTCAGRACAGNCARGREGGIEAGVVIVAAGACLLIADTAAGVDLTSVCVST